jgi:hypothetical protein
VEAVALSFGAEICVERQKGQAAGAVAVAELVVDVFTAALHRHVDACRNGGAGGLDSLHQLRGTLAAQQPGLPLSVKPCAIAVAF